MERNDNDTSIKNDDERENVTMTMLPPVREAKLSYSSVQATIQQFLKEHQQLSETRFTELTARAELKIVQLTKELSEKDKALAEEYKAREILKKESREREELKKQMKRMHDTENALKAQLAQKHDTENALKAQFAQKHDTENALKAQLAQKHDTENALKAQLAQKLDTENALKAQLAQKHDTENALKAQLAQKLDTENALKAQLAQKHDKENALKAQLAQKHDTENALKAQLAQKHDMENALKAQLAQKHDKENALKAQLAQKHDMENALKAQLAQKLDTENALKAQLAQNLDAENAEKVRLAKKNNEQIQKLTEAHIVIRQKLQASHEREKEIIATSMDKSMKSLRMELQTITGQLEASRQAKDDRDGQLDSALIQKKELEAQVKLLEDKLEAAKLKAKKVSALQSQLDKAECTLKRYRSKFSSSRNQTKVGETERFSLELELKEIKSKLSMAQKEVLSKANEIKFLRVLLNDCGCNVSKKFNLSTPPQEAKSMADKIMAMIAAIDNVKDEADVTTPIKLRKVT